MISVNEAPMLAAAISAENAQPGFCDRAAEVILRELRKLGQAEGEMLVDLAKLRGIEPRDARAFGAVFKRLSVDGAIRQVGWCNRRKGHNSGGGRIWAINA